jgi:ABC-type amino acid transport substrate-binding protein
MQETEKQANSGTLRIGANIQEGIQGAPWAWRDEQVRMYLGFEIDIATKISDYLGLQPQFIPMDGPRMIMGLMTDKCRIAIGAIKSENTMAGVIFTKPYYYLTQRIITLEDSSVYDLVDLKRTPVGVLTGSIANFILIEENKNLPAPIEIVKFDDVVELFSALQFREITAIFIDSPVALWYSKSNMDRKFRVSDVAYKSGSYSIALHENDVELRNAINSILSDIDLREILDKYGLWDEAQESY